MAARASSMQAVAGASQLSNRNNSSLADGAGKSPCLILAEGRRGSQEFNWVSNQFVSFICCPFQTEFDLLQTVAVPARRGIRRNFQPPADLVKCVAMPYFQHNHFPLFHRQ